MKVELVPDFAVLKCESEPTGADVFLNGNRKGKTPLELQKIPSGSHKIEFRLKGYSNYLRDIVVQAGQNQTVSASLQHLPCSFQVVTEPAGAKVFLGTSSRRSAVSLKPSRRTRDKTNSPVMPTLSAQTRWLGQGDNRKSLPWKKTAVCSSYNQRRGKRFINGKQACQNRNPCISSRLK